MTGPLLGTSQRRSDSARSGASPRSRFGDLTLSDGGHVFDRKTGRSYQVNPSGCLILELTRAGCSAPQVIDALASRYAQHPAVVTAAVDAFYRQMERYLP